MKKNFVWWSLISTIALIVVLEVGLTYWSLYYSTVHYKSKASDPLVLCQITTTEFYLTNTQPNHNDKNNIKQNISFPDYLKTVKQEKDKNNTYIVNNPHSILVLVNKERKLPDNFIPTQLIVPNVRFANEDSNEKKQMKAVAALALEELFDAAKQSGYYLYGVSGYRSFDRQKSIYNKFVEDNGKEKANTFSASPGTSEHQTGLSMDISVESQKFLLTEEFGDTPEGKWLNNNAHEFGFILRYPKEKVGITGYIYEPWHIRYVGMEHATYLFNNNLVLEEAMTK